VEKVKTEADEFHEKRKAARAAITQAFMCVTHSLPDKPAVCWKEPVQGLCYPVTENNLNLWATMHVRFATYLYKYLPYDSVLQVQDPEKYAVTTKPLEINVYNNAPRTRAPAQNIAPVASIPPVPPTAPPFPYGYYPPPSAYGPPAWYSPPTGYVQGHPQYGQVPGYAQTPVLPPTTKIEYPMISEWLKYCDRHPQRRGENLSDHGWKFDKEGYRRIHQLTGDRITVENLSDWLMIGKGTADLLIRYAEEDIELVKAGTFMMVSGDD
jgi:hypothetical protein